MTNNKQQTAVEWFSVRRDVLEIEVRLGKLSPIEYAEELTKAEQQAKEMEMEQKELDYSDGYKDGYARATDLAIDKLKELIPRINDNTSISFQNTTTNTTTGYPKGATITDLK